ncbi:putative N-acetyltransferase 8B [Eleutherodactylus coqui]|uniref:putative N-acetyltransferase 8B n=1 Tax=Eleutherodactylus coqui TaxID=57060 RepID=UPI003462DD0A
MRGALVAGRASTGGKRKVKGDNMSAYKVRLYKESDLHSAQELFISGCREHISPCFYHALKQPRCWLLLLVGLLLPLATYGSIVLSLLAGIGVLIILWLPGREFFLYHARRGVAVDLKDIRKYYLEREGYCFWVVELEGEVVGTVAAIPAITPHEKNVELKRMMVSSHHRGKGIAKLLCRTLIDYARRRGCNAVVLTTTSIQISGVQLYTKLGFKTTETDLYNPFLGLVGISWLGFRYDISSSG